jgi:hypothetical protein
MSPYRSAMFHRCGIENLCRQKKKCSGNEQSEERETSPRECGVDCSGERSERISEKVNSDRGFAADRPVDGQP